MPTVANIKKTMRKKGIPAELIAQFEFPKPSGNQTEEVLSLINQMDKLLTREQCLSIMEEQGCYKTEKVVAPFREFEQKYVNKTVEEKIQLLTELDTPHRIPCHLNPDGTLSIYWGFGQEGNYECICRKMNHKYKSEPVNVSKTFCGCCAGHVRNTYQHALGVNLRLKEIVSSPISSDGKKQCEFLFEVEENAAK
jgi:hypothetical protein